MRDMLDILLLQSVLGGLRMHTTMLPFALFPVLLGIALAQGHTKEVMGLGCYIFFWLLSPKRGAVSAGGTHIPVLQIQGDHARVCFEVQRLA